VDISFEDDVTVILIGVSFMIRLLRIERTKSKRGVRLAVLVEGARVGWRQLQRKSVAFVQFLFHGERLGQGACTVERGITWVPIVRES
jgi:hypothetical protein